MKKNNLLSIYWNWHDIDIIIIMIWGQAILAKLYYNNSTKTWTKNTKCFNVFIDFNVSEHWTAIDFSSNQFWIIKEELNIVQLWLRAWKPFDVLIGITSFLSGQ